MLSVASLLYAFSHIILTVTFNRHKYSSGKVFGLDIILQYSGEYVLRFDLILKNNITIVTNTEHVLIRKEYLNLLTETALGTAYTIPQKIWLYI